jgi:hypothetical protein
MNNDVARKQHAELRLRLERPVGELRVARAEDHVGLAFDAELLSQSGADVDLAEHSEAFRVQFPAHACESLVEGDGYRGRQRVAGCEHRPPPRFGPSSVEEGVPRIRRHSDRAP